MSKDDLKFLVDVVAELQGQAIADQTMIESMLMAHPDPGKLRDCWDRLASSRLALANLDAVTKSRATDHAETYHLKAWDSKLKKYFPEA